MMNCMHLECDFVCISHFAANEHESQNPTHFVELAIADAPIRDADTDKYWSK